MKINLKFWSRCIEILLMLIIAWAVVAPVLTCFFGIQFGGEKMIKMTEDLYGFNINNFSLMKRILLYVVTSIGTTLMVYMLWLGIKVSRQWNKGEILTQQTALLFSRMGNIWILFNLYSIAQQAFFVFVIATKQPYNLL